MRWFFIAVLLANFMVLYYGIEKSHEGADISIPNGQGVGQLKLLDEQKLMSSDQSLEIAIPSYVPVKEEEKEVSTNSSKQEVTELTKQKELEPLFNPVSEQKTVIVDDSVSAKAVDQLGNSNGETAFSESELLVPEKSIGQESELSQEDTVAEQVIEPAVENFCGAFGVFQKGSEGRHLLEQLEGLGMTASLRREKVDKTVGYWVIIPSFDTRQQAIDTVNQLRAKGVKDIHRFVRDDQKQGISLGLFSQRKNAERRQKEIFKKGQEVEINPRTKVQEEYRVDFRGTESQLTQATVRFEKDGIKYIQENYPCSRIVTDDSL